MIALLASRPRVRCAALALPFLVLLQPDLVAQKAAVPDSLDRMNQAIDALTRKVWPSVVQIMVTGYGARDDRHDEGRGDVTAMMTRQRSMGSGFVIEPDGYIMTNAHVVSGAQRVQVILPPINADGSLMSALSPKMTVLPARIVGISSEIDLALLKVDGLKAPALPLATYRDVRQGETVFAFGSPGGLRNTLTHGLISSVARQTDPDSPLIYIQTDAPINPGNSGGPLVNVRGEVVGVNTFILSQSGGNEGLGFAIPSATARTVFRQLKQYGQLRRQEVGMSLQTITQTMAASLGLARDSGVIVSDVWPNGPAEAAGLRIGDVLLSVDGQAAENLPTVNYYFRLRDSDTPVELVVLDGTTQKMLRVNAIEQKSEFDAVSLTFDPERNLVAELGIIGVEIDPRLAAGAKGLRDYYGIMVAARAAGAVTEIPLLPRDIIRSLNNQQTATLAGLRQLLQGLKPGAAVTLHIQRESRLMYVSFTME
jgi:serine protease Do